MMYGVSLLLYYIISAWKNIKGAQWIIVIGLILTFLSIFLFALTPPGFFKTVFYMGIKFSFSICLGLYLVLRFRENFQERKLILENQNKLLEQKVTERTEETQCIIRPSSIYPVPTHSIRKTGLSGRTHCRHRPRNPESAELCQ